MSHILDDNARRLIQELRACGGRGAISPLVDDGVNETTPRLLMNLLATVTEWNIQTTDEFGGEWELYLHLPAGLSFEAGLLIAWNIDHIFLGEWDYEHVNGQVVVRVHGEV